MKVSIIIPVYNVEKYVEDAVESALFLEETGEIVLVEDGSKDNSFAVCQKLANEYDKIKLFTHENRQNKGVSATRNLGIKKAHCEYVSFLDADDLYLPNRFTKAKELFTKYSEIDGVYEFSDKFFENKQKEIIKDKSNNKFPQPIKEVKPENLFESLLIKNIGYWCTYSITIKKSIFEKTGYFDENLVIGEDTAMWLKMSALARLMPGCLNQPVCMVRRRINSATSSSEKVAQEMPLLWKTLWDWGYNNNLDSRKLDLLFYRHVENCLQSVKNQNFIIKRLYKFQLITKLLCKYPKIIKNESFWQYVKSLIGFSKIELIFKMN